jgi:hypothetical protein
MTLQLIGAGFGRTGTRSLKTALEHLGFAPCHHMGNVLANPIEVETWHAAARGETVDWRAFLSDYRALLDWSSCEFWRELAAIYPDAKVLLSVRDPKLWQRSFSKTIEIELREPAPPGDPVYGAWHAMVTDLIAKRRFNNNFDPGHVIEIFNDHVAAVQESIPHDRLLTYDVKEGWGPLCRFLGVPEPEIPFPNSNTTQDFIENRDARREKGLQG